MATALLRTPKQATVRAQAQSAVQRPVRNEETRSEGFRLRLRGGGTNAPPDAGERPGSSHNKVMGTAVGSKERIMFEGRCLCWNARQLLPPAPWGKESSAVKQSGAARKLEFLETQIDCHAPWLVALMEVGGGLDRMKWLRAWFKKRGFYDMVFLIGDGSSTGPGEGAGPDMACTNGIALAAHRDVEVLSSRRLGFRTLAVTLLHKPSLQRLAVCIVHGASSEKTVLSSAEDLEDERASFLDQLETASAWCCDKGGALLMDANRVPCRSWHNPAQPRLSRGDRALRSLCKWECTCCSHNGVSQSALHAKLIGEQLQASGSPSWTRTGEVEGKRMLSRLDIGLAFGEAENRWTGAKLVDSVIRSNRGELRVSDHSLVVYSISLFTSCAKGLDRPLPVKLGPRPRCDSAFNPKSPWHVMADIMGETSRLQAIKEKLDRAVADGHSCVQTLVPIVRGAGEEAVRRAKRKSGPAVDGAHTPQDFDDASERASWRTRLQLAQALARGHRDASKQEWACLFHPRSGMRRLCPRYSPEATAAIPWFEVIARCRRQLNRAERFYQKRQTSEDLWLAQKCKAIEDQAGDGNMAPHVHTVWRMISRRSGQSKINALHRGDVKEEPLISVDDPEFLAEAGRIGEAFVEQMDRGAIKEGFSAWLRVFCSPHDVVTGAHGAEWSLQEEFSFEIFGKVLKAMQGKAVGAGGLSVELLLAAGRDVQWLFYRALLHDVESGTISPEWRQVLYVLLRKPPPNDAAIIAQRREIALMPQDLKILLQGVRLVAYGKVCERVDAAQFGWKRGMGCADPSLALACVLDQTRRLQHKAWILYVDLANFFPAINRSIACMSELFMDCQKKWPRCWGRSMGDNAVNHRTCLVSTRQAPA